MSVTGLLDVQNQIQKFWSPIFMPELRKAALLASLVNKDYEGEIKKGGDTVRVSQILQATGENLTVGTDADSFNTEALQTAYVDIKADKRAVASFEIEELAQLQSQLESKDSEIRKALMDGVMQQINKYLYSLVAPSQSNPDHLRNSISSFDATELGAIRMLASQARWNKQKGKIILADPSYYSDLLAAQTITSKDYVDGEAPMVGGQIANKRMGFDIYEDDSLAVDQALSFSPDFMHLVMQTQPTFRVSDQHVNKKFGYIVSVDLIYGAKLGIAGDKKHILSTAAASGSTVTMAD